MTENEATAEDLIDQLAESVRDEYTLRRVILHIQSRIIRRYILSATHVRLIECFVAIAKKIDYEDCFDSHHQSNRVERLSLRLFCLKQQLLAHMVPVYDDCISSP